MAKEKLLGPEILKNFVDKKTDLHLKKIFYVKNYDGKTNQHSIYFRNGVGNEAQAAEGKDSKITSIM